MVEQNDYIDISPEKGGHKGLQFTVFQETEITQVNKNPNRLTLEGAEEKISLWKGSSNKHIFLKYQTMIARCKDFAPSGKTSDGKIILSRYPDGSPNWVKEGSFIPREELATTKGGKK